MNSDPPVESSPKPDSSRLKKRLARLALFTSGILVTTIAASWIYFHPPARRQRGICYGNRAGVSLHFDVATPAAPNGLGIVFIVSGGWKSNPSRAHEWLIAPFLRHGYTVFSVFHLSQPQATVAEIFTDVSQAVRFIRSHADDYCIDPDRLGVIGGSAGGHLSLLLATQGGFHSGTELPSSEPLVQAAAVFCPVTDLTDLTGSTEDPGDGGPPRNFRAAFDQQTIDMSRWQKTARELSPLHHVTSKLPSVLIFHGNCDTLVPISQSERFRDAAATAGCDVELVVIRGAGHTWLTMPLQVMQAAHWFDAQL